jgi:hypothetical protein
MKFTRALASMIAVACAAATPPGPPPGPPPLTGSARFDPRPSECQPAPSPRVGRVDVAIVIDTSRSTGLPSGFDVDSDGSVGSKVPDRAFWISSEPGDSMLAAQVRTARSLIAHFSSPDARFSIVTYSGVNPRDPNRRTQDSVIESGLTSDVAALATALDRAQSSGSIGAKVFSAGMEAALKALDTPGGPRDSGRRIALFVSDDVRPIVLTLGGDPSALGILA